MKSSFIQWVEYIPASGRRTLRGSGHVKGDNNGKDPLSQVTSRHFLSLRGLSTGMRRRASRTDLAAVIRTGVSSLPWCCSVRKVDSAFLVFCVNRQSCDDLRKYFGRAQWSIPLAHLFILVAWTLLRPENSWQWCGWRLTILRWLLGINHEALRLK